MDEVRRGCLLFLMLPRDELMYIYIHIYIQRLIGFAVPVLCKVIPFPELKQWLTLTSIDRVIITTRLKVC